MAERGVGDAILSLHHEIVELVRERDGARCERDALAGRVASLTQYCPHPHWHYFPPGCFQPTWPEHSMRCALCGADRPKPDATSTKDG